MEVLIMQDVKDYQNNEEKYLVIMKLISFIVIAYVIMIFVTAKIQDSVNCKSCQERGFCQLIFSFAVVIGWPIILIVLLITIRSNQIRKIKTRRKNFNIEIINSLYYKNHNRE